VRRCVAKRVPVFEIDQTDHPHPAGSGG
jgi:hypothetical protein